MTGWDWFALIGNLFGAVHFGLASVSDPSTYQAVMFGVSAFFAGNFVRKWAVGV